MTEDVLVGVYYGKFVTMLTMNGLGKSVLEECDEYDEHDAASD